MSPPWAGIPLHTGICIAVGKYEELNVNHKLLFKEKEIWKNKYNFFFLETGINNPDLNKCKFETIVSVSK